MVKARAAVNLEKPVFKGEYRAILDEVYELLIRLWDEHYTSPVFAGDEMIFALGGNGYSVREVIETARQVTGKEIPVRIGPRRAGDPAILIASSDKIKSELGWQPQFQDLRVIIESAWRWMLAHPNAYAE